MRHIYFAIVLIQMTFMTPKGVRAEITCSPQASGVSGVISDRKDTIAAVNCLGQQLATLRNAASTADQTEAMKIEQLAREISALSAAVGGLSQRIDALERNLTNIQTPLASRPW